MNETSVESLAKAMNYPEAVPAGAARFAFYVDDRRVLAREDRGRLVLSCELGASGDVDMAALAGYAAGRLLKEEATLAYDPESDNLILWQEFPARSAPELLLRFFEVFVASTDWWLSRVRDAASHSSIPEMVIQP